MPERQGGITFRWGNRAKTYRQEALIAADLVRQRDSKWVLRKALSIGVGIVNPAELRWLHSNLMTFKDGVDSGAVVLENELEKEQQNGY